MISSKDLLPLVKKLDKRSPCGEDLTYSTLYDDIKKLRASNTTDLPQGVWEEDAPKADWYRVAKICTHLLTKESKDLQVALWLSEAWFFLHGLPGLFHGVLLIHGLLKNFWMDLYPRCDEPIERLYLFDWFSQTMDNALLTLAICQPQTPGVEAYSYANYIDAQHLNTVSQKQKDPEHFLKREGRPLKDDIEKSISDTLMTFYDILEHNLHKVKDALDQLEGFFQDKSSLSESLFFQIQKRIEGLLTLAPILRKRGREKTPAPSKKGLISTLKDGFLNPPRTDENQGNTKPKSMLDREASVASPPAIPQHSGPRPDSRADAYALLKDVASYLIKNDPQSPVPYLLERIHTWEHKSFPEIANDFATPSEAALFLGEFFRNREKSG